MPIYEFICENCERKFSILVITYEDHKNIRCPHCGSENVKRVFSPFGGINANSSRSGSCTSFG